MDGMERKGRMTLQCRGGREGKTSTGIQERIWSVQSIKADVSDRRFLFMCHSNDEMLEHFGLLLFFTKYGVSID